MSKTANQELKEARVKIATLESDIEVCERNEAQRIDRVKRLETEREDMRTKASNLKHENTVARAELRNLQRENERLKGYIDRVLDYDRSEFKGPRVEPDELPSVPYVNTPRPFNY